MSTMAHTILLVPPSKPGYIRDTYYGCWHRRKFVHYSWPPLMLYYLQALLPGSTVLDAPAHGLDADATLDSLSSLEPDAVLTSIGTFTAADDAPVLKRIRAEIGCNIMLFGEFPTTQPDAALTMADAVITGEPEAAVQHHGPALVQKKGIIKAGLVRDLDSLPFPQRVLAERDLYFNPLAKRSPFTTLLASRGCPHECIFCSVPAVYGRTYRTRSPENVLKELSQLEEQGFKEVFFRDENIALKRTFTAALCEKMLSHGISMRWMANARVDSVDEVLLGMMRESGCTLLKFGVESLSDETLRGIKKGSTTEDVRRAFSLAEEKGIETMAHMILGLPGETEADIRRNVDRLLELHPTYASFDVVLTYPGTELDSLSKRGKGNRIPAGQLEQLHNWAFRRFYLRPTIIGKHILRLGSTDELVSKAKATLQLWRGLLTGK